MTTSDPDIVIVGAGAAGIGAARRLSGHCYSTVIIEQLPRTGGRAWTYATNAGPVDLGCGWLHSADRNPWTRIAAELGFVVDRRVTAWGEQFKELGFSSKDRAAARNAFALWNEDIRKNPPASDRASDALNPNSPWTPYLQALSGYISGDELEHISVTDYVAYDDASTENNWRVADGYGHLITSALPADAALRLGTPLEGLDLSERKIVLQTSAGTIRTSAVIFTISSNVLAGGAIKLPRAFDPWRQAASLLPLGNNEKLYFEVLDGGPFEDETHVLGDPHDSMTGTYYIRPFGQPVLECFLGGAGAQAASAMGHEAAFDHAINQLTDLFGSDTRKYLKPLAASNWASTPSIGGGYSHALPGHANTRMQLAQSFDGRVFFAGEATHTTDFSTAHGAYQSGQRAADEAMASLMVRVKASGADRR
jgi:monoamine oxidase